MIKFKKMINIDFEHRQNIMICVKMGKHSIPYEYFLTLSRIITDSSSTFNFFYYENDMKDFLLEENIIEKDRDNEDSDTEITMYKMKNYKKYKKLIDSIINLFELNYDELRMDYRSAKITSVIETT